MLKFLRKYKEIIFFIYIMWAENVSKSFLDAHIVTKIGIYIFILV